MSTVFVNVTVANARIVHLTHLITEHTTVNTRMTETRTLNVGAYVLIV